jgi:adenylylsulfate kinase
MKIFTICFTGTSGSGKTTLANALGKKLDERNIKNQILDGDVTRKEIGNAFGYTKEERTKMALVNRLVAQYLNRNGINVMLAIVAPYAEVREGIREHIGDGYIEIYVKCSYEECARRDSKGYYKLEKEGKLKNLSGANDIYEVPKNPELVIDTEVESVDDSVEKIVKYLIDNGYIQ